jgi:hypothetical protein
MYSQDIFYSANSLEDLLTYENCFDAEWCNNEGVGNAQNNVEVYWKIWSKKKIPSMPLLHSRFIELTLEKVKKLGIIVVL